MDLAKKLAAVIAALIIIVFVVMLARWVGDQVRLRFLTPKTVVTTNIPADTLLEKAGPVTAKSKTATYSAIPKTGPVETAYLIMGLTFLTGISSLALARKTS